MPAFDIAFGTRAAAACLPSASVLKSPRKRSQEMQAKALNDRGDIVGFADGRQGSRPIHAILWKQGKRAGAVDLGVPRGFVASEAYGINDDRVVFGLLYDKRERMFPFRWRNGRICAPCAGRAAARRFLPGLRGHAWTLAWSINGDGVVSG